MKTKITSLKKVASLLLLFIFNSKLHSQIIYTDIPDATPSATYSLDLNNDLIDDFIIHYGTPNKVMCSPLNSNAYSGDFVGGVHLPWALSQSSNICDTLLTWHDSSSPGTMALGTSLGYWVGATDKYLALKLIVSTNTYYGWARLDILASSGSFTLKDYAYESTPNLCIQAGQTPSGISELISRNVLSIVPNPFISSTTIKTTVHLENATLTICNVFGQILKRINNISGQTVSIFRDGLPSGQYFIQLTEEDKIIAVKKLIISD